MKLYWLEMNSMYACTHVVRAHWFRRMFGKHRLVIDKCQAKTRKEAIATFRERGWTVGILFWKA